MKIKNILLVLFLFGVMQFGNAQTQEGKVQLSGYFSSRLSLDNNGSGSSIFPSVTVGYFINDHVVVKGEIVLLAQLNVINDERSVRWGLGYGMGGKYYFGETKLQPFIGFDAYYATNPKIFNEVNYNHLDLTLEPGVSFFIKENVAIEAALPFEYIRGMLIDTQNPDNSSFSNSFFSTLSIGFQIYLR